MEFGNLGWESIFYILSGCWVNLGYMILSLLGGAGLGLVLALCKINSKISPQAGFQNESSFISVLLRRGLYRFAVIYTSLFRGTPLLLQLSLVYFGLPNLFQIQISAFVAGVIAFSLNSAAYLSETLRAGVESLDRGQLDAARVLQIPYWATVKDILLPQALRNILPALANESISLLKETALISTLGQEDLMRRSQLVSAEKYTYFGPLLVAAAGYYFLVLILSLIFKQIEKKFSYV
ncbi:MAG: amino acid ABC transporter permease [Candidatus Melainabacteria bacterium]|nr:amino acid ABC transporter permease [Candidatus Melainabacteria bacterium]